MASGRQREKPNFSKVEAICNGHTSHCHCWRPCRRASTAEEARAGLRNGLPEATADPVGRGARRRRLSVTRWRRPCGTQGLKRECARRSRKQAARKDFMGDSLRGQNLDKGDERDTCTWEGGQAHTRPPTRDSQRRQSPCLGRRAESRAG